MNIEHFSGEPDLFATGSPLSQVTTAGGFAFVSGQTARDRDGRFIVDTFEAEVRCVLRNLVSALESVGASPDDVCKIQAFITDPALFEDFNRIYREVLGPDPFPARTTVVTALAREQLHVEVEAIAYLGGS